MSVRSLVLALLVYGYASAHDVRLVEARIDGPSAAELTPPVDASPAAPEQRAFETVQLGRDLYLLRNIATEGLLSYNVPVVVFDNFVLVVEAALKDATSQRVIECVSAIAPGKPIRLVLTHHHGDHIGGLRTYIANGTPIIVPRGMRRLVERIAGTHSAIASDELARSPRAPIESLRRLRS